MVDSNIQMEEILPSEKAYSYKMKLDAIKHQGRKIEETSDQLGGKNNESAQLLGEDQGDSGTQVRRYIRLTKLIPEILKKVDEKRIAFNPAVEISYLTQEEQTKLYDAMECNDATPSLGQAIHLKKLSQAGMLTQEDIDNTMSQIKPNQIPKIKFNDERIRKILPKSLTEEKIEDYVVEAISFYNKYLNKEKERRDKVGVINTIIILSSVALILWGIVLYSACKVSGEISEIENEGVPITKSPPYNHTQ